MYRIHLRRSAFTLIELLVVIAIIAILSSLILGGVMVFLRKGPEVQDQNDLLQLSNALQKFQSDHKFYPPSRIRLCSNRTDYTASALDQLSLQAIGTIWPNLPPNFVGLNWDGTGMPQKHTLDGDQCLVFFLGGMPNPAGGLQGFSTIATNPTAAGGDRKSYFEFQPARLQVRPTASSPFPSYMNAHKKLPYVYFSSGRRPDGYDDTHAIVGLGGVAPYKQAASKYYNSTSFQLISAGADGAFGAGGLWSPGNGNQASKDDISNFHNGKLGSQ